MSVQPLSPSSVPTVESGYVSARSGYWWDILALETAPELFWPANLDVYDRMRRQDAQVQSVLRAVTLPVRRSTWRIHPGTASDEVTAFVAVNLGLPVAGMPPEEQPDPGPRQRSRFSWRTHLKDVLLMLPYGHMYFEQVYRIEGDFAWLRKLGPRMPRTIQKIQVARDGGLEWIEQAAERGKDPVRIPADRLVAYVLEKEGADWTGTSLLRPAYKNWLIKDRLLRIGVQTLERNGMGVPRYTASEKETDLSAGEKLATEWRSGESAGAAIPYGAQLDLVGVSGDIPDGLPWIRYMDEQIARAVLAHFLNLGTQTGSWALGSTFADFFTQSLQAVADEIADVATQHVVEDLVDINFGGNEPAPRLICDEIGSKRELTAEAITILTNAGVIRTDRDLEEFVRDAYGLPPKQFPPPPDVDSPPSEEVPA